jgi:hypothetical protein
MKSVSAQRITAVIFMLFVGFVANGAIVTTSGNMTVFSSATADYTASPYNDPAPAPTHIWNEQTGVTLPSDVVLDTDLADSTLRYVTGSVDPGEVAFSAGGGPTLAAGTAVDVYYAYFDPAGTQNGSGSVTFDQPVLGIVAHTSQLPLSDFLRVGGAPYPGTSAFTNRGWEVQEWGQLSADRLTLTFFGNASNPGDQFRIFVTPGANVVVPEPSTWAMLLAGTAAVLLGGVRRRRSG